MYDNDPYWIPSNRIIESPFAYLGHVNVMSTTRSRGVKYCTLSIPSHLPWELLTNFCRAPVGDSSLRKLHTWKLRVAATLFHLCLGINK